MSRHARHQPRPCPLRTPIRRNTAARLSLQPERRVRPSSIIRFPEPVSEETMRELERRFVDQVPGYVFLLPGEPDPPMVVRTPPRRPPWWRPLLARSRW